MNLSETVDKIIELHQQPVSAEKSVAEYLESTLLTATANVDVQRFSYSVQTHAWVGGAVFILSVVLFVSIMKRWRRAAFVSAFAVPMILSLELLVNVPLVSWPTLKRSENIIADFPVQNATRRVIIGTSITLGAHQEMSGPTSSRFEATVKTFLLPVTLVITIIGLWQVLMCFGKLEFEDAHTIMLIMGTTCAIYFALLCGVYIKTGANRKVTSTPRHNAGSIAVLAALAEDLAQKYPRLESTWVTVAFIGSGPDSRGARALARKVAHKRKRKLPTYFIGCEHVAGGGPHGYMISSDVNDNPLFAERDLIRGLDRAATAVMGRQLEIVPGGVTNLKGFADYGVPSIAITTLPQARGDEPGGEPEREHIDRGQLLVSLQLIEAVLSQFEQPQSF